MTVKTCAPNEARARYMTCEACDSCARRFLHIFVIKPRANAKTIQRFTNIFSNIYPLLPLKSQLSDVFEIGVVLVHIMSTKAANIRPPLP